MSTYVWQLPALNPPLEPADDLRPPSPAVTACWTGTLSAFEEKLLQALPSYGLDSLRLRLLFAIVDDHALDKGARAMLQMAFETELRTPLARLITLPAGVTESNVCQRRRFLDIDRDMQLHRYLIGPAFSELGANPLVPVEYVNMLQAYSVAAYARYRMCALAATVCLATALLVP